jgi:hypothetical protein
MTVHLNQGLDLGHFVIDRALPTTKLEREKRIAAAAAVQQELSRALVLFESCCYLR